MLEFIILMGGYYRKIFINIVLDYNVISKKFIFKKNKKLAQCNK